MALHSELLREAPRTFEQLSTMTKATDLRTSAKAAIARPAPRPEPNIAELDRWQDAERMLVGAPFCGTESEDLERDRIAGRNRQLAAKNKQGEERRRAWVAQMTTRPPWWRR